MEDYVIENVRYGSSTALSSSKLQSKYIHTHIYMCMYICLYGFVNSSSRKVLVAKPDNPNLLVMEGKNQLSLARPCMHTFCMHTHAHTYSFK